MINKKVAKIHILKYLVFSRWFLHLGIVMLGLLQKVIGAAQFNNKVFLLLAISYSINGCYYLFLRRDPNKISSRAVYIVSVLQVILDQILYTVIIYNTGGIESMSYLFYFVTIFMSIVLFNEIEIIALTFLSGFLYLAIIVGEYINLFPHIWRYNFDPGFYHNLAITVHNSATVMLILIFIAFFAAFISRVIRSREEALEAETEKVSTTIENLLDGVLVLNQQGKIILINQPACELLNIKNSNSLINKRISVHIFNKELKELIDFIVNTALSKVNKTKQIVIIKNEREITLKVHCLTLLDNLGSIKGYLTVMRDVSREKELDKLKSDFISIAAHQLRTPLSTIKWLFKIFLDGDAGDLNAKQKDLLTKGLQRNNEVIEIVNNLLDVTEIEEGRLPFKKDFFEMEPIIEQVYNSAKYNAEQKKVNLIYQKYKKPLPKFFIDVQKIRIAFQNLVDNAIKYTRSGGTVEITVTIQNNDLVFKVKDEGIGISKYEGNKIFSKFFRTRKAILEEPTGSGLGLYIVKNIIKNHQGETWFTSEEGKGTTFYIRIPIQS